MQDDSVVVFRLWWLLLALLGASIFVLGFWTLRWILGVLVRMTHGYA